MSHSGAGHGLHQIGCHGDTSSERRRKNRGDECKTRPSDIFRMKGVQVLNWGVEPGVEARNKRYTKWCRRTDAEKTSEEVERHGGRKREKPDPIMPLHRSHKTMHRLPQATSVYSVCKLRTAGYLTSPDTSIGREQASLVFNSFPPSWTLKVPLPVDFDLELSLLRVLLVFAVAPSKNPFAFSFWAGQNWLRTLREKRTQLHAYLLTLGAV
ncbi:hypothetical protein DFH09DRAFT_1281186 [Mycena vulgaris]|nr:hypothetical protein DFH09DRAFT_1281186 [Mycena vulgaris]